jgi:hypothetical protein
MKKIYLLAAISILIGSSACHYGEGEATQTLERNEKYKTDNQQYSVNRAGDGGKMQHEEKATPAATESHAADTVATAEQHH